MNDALKERIKYRASALDRASTACFVGAVITPGAGLANETLTTFTLTESTFFGTIFWLVAGVLLHCGGARVLKGLEQ